MKKIIPVIFILLLASCAGGNYTRIVYINSDVSRFNNINPLDDQKTVFVAPTREQMGDIEYESYRAHLVRRLIGQGFALENDIKKADYVAQLFYGMGDRIDRQVSRPVFEMVGGGSTTHRGTVVDSSGNISNVSVTSDNDSSYEMVGVANDTVIHYERHLTLVMYDNKASSSGNVIQSYKADVKSEGQSKSISAVAFCLIDSVFTNFYKAGSERVTLDSSTCAR